MNTFYRQPSSLLPYFVDQVNSCLQDKEETQLDEGEKSITVDECLIDIIKGNRQIIINRK